MTARYFTAFPLPRHVAEHLAQALDARLDLPARARRTPRDNWHITIAYYGQDADRPAKFAEIDVTAPAPRLRLRSTGTFANVSWVGVDVDDLAALRAIVATADGRPDRFVPHVTIVKWDNGEPVDPGLHDYLGPEWTPDELVLYRTDRDIDAGPVYTPIDQVKLLQPE